MSMADNFNDDNGLAAAQQQARIAALRKEEQQRQAAGAGKQNPMSAFSLRSLIDKIGTAGDMSFSMLTGLSPWMNIKLFYGKMVRDGRDPLVPPLRVSDLMPGSSFMPQPIEPPIPDKALYPAVITMDFLGVVRLLIGFFTIIIPMLPAIAVGAVGIFGISALYDTLSPYLGGLGL